MGTAVLPLRAAGNALRRMPALRLAGAERSGREDGMKPARWGVKVEYATTGARVWGSVVAHVFTDDSSAPACQPNVPGSPGVLYEGPSAEHCATCAGLLATAAWSVTTFGKKVLWTARNLGERPLLSARAEGVAANEAEAFEQALAAVAKLVPSGTPTRVMRMGEADALAVARERRAEQRAKKIGTGTGAQQVEYVYRHHKRYPSWFSASFEWQTETARVLRKTAKRLFVQDTIGTYTTAGGVMVLKTFALDRQQLERGTHRYGWTLNPHPPADGSGSKPGWAEVLGVAATCTLAEAKRAFRQAAKAAHPDNGGTAEAFQRVKSAYDAAAQHFGGAA